MICLCILEREEELTAKADRMQRWLIIHWQTEVWIVGLTRTSSSSLEKGMVPVKAVCIWRMSYLMKSVILPLPCSDFSLRSFRKGATCGHASSSSLVNA